MQIRTASRDDIPLLLKLYRHLHPDNENISVSDAQDRWQQLGRLSGSDIFVGCLGDLIVTSCTLVVIPNITRSGAPYALIENVVTDAAHRNQGYGKAVLRDAIEAAWRAQCYKIMLLTGSQRASTLRFYQDIGFVQNKTGFQIRRSAARQPLS